MNTILRYLLIITTATMSCITMADVVPYVAFRSQGINGAREMVGWQTHINKFDMDQIYGSFSITPAFSRSFHHKQLAAALFCDALTAHHVEDESEYHHGHHNHHHQTSCSFSTTSSCCNSCNICCCDCPLIKIQGSKIRHRDPKALMAENFYLPSDYSSEVSFNPVINNVLVDFNFYCSFDEWLEGLYVRIHTPLCYTRWNLQMYERIRKTGFESYDAGYFNDTFTPTDFNEPRVHGLSRSSMLANFTEFVCAGHSITGVPGITYEGLAYARMNTSNKHETRLAEITAALGYNFLLCEDYYLGFNIRAAAPTGNKPKALWLFEPIVGNGHHWELGAGLDSRWCIWRSEEEERDVTCYLDATLTHLFKTTQIRTFDLRCKPLSRYMLAMKFTPTVQNLIVGQSVDPINATPPNSQFANIYTPVANLTTGPCSVSAAVQGEVVFKVAYTWHNLQWDTGYNFWGRSCLKIHRQHEKCTQFTTNTWGLKGDAFVYGFPTTFNPLTVNSTGIPLSATEQNASIFEGTNRPYDIRFINPHANETTKWNMNPGVDNSGWAFDSAHIALATHTVGEQDPVTHQAIWYQTRSSQEPILLTEDDIDVEGAQTNSYSNKLFMHFSYTWQNIQDWTPYFGAGGEIEFGSHEQCCCRSSSRATCTALSCKKPCTECCLQSCRTVSLTQWGIWLKAGFSFK